MVASILAALRLAEQTDEMQVVDVSLLATALWSMATDIAPSLIDRRPLRTRDRRNELNPAGQPLSVRRRWLDHRQHARGALVAEASARPIGEAEWGVDPDFDTPKKRYDRMNEIVDRHRRHHGWSKTSKEWGQIFDDGGLIWGPVQTIPEVVDDPQARAVGMFVEQEYPDGRGTFETVAIPIRIEGADIGPRGAAPALGAHTDEVLTGIGLSAGEIAQLRSEGVIAD